MNSEVPLHQLRTLQPAALQALHQSPDGLHLQSLPPFPQDLDALSPDANNETIFQQRYHLGAAPQAPHGLHAPNPFQHNAGLPHAQTQFQPVPAGYQHGGHRFNLVAPRPPLRQHMQAPLRQHIQAPPQQHIRAPPQQHIQTSPQQHIQAPPQQHIRAPPPLPPPPVPRAPQQFPETEAQQTHNVHPAQDTEETPVSNHGQFEGLKLIPTPPKLDEWRSKLFHVDDTITLTEEQFRTYFPHIDNVYSHRSTQRHKRKRFVSHYWDCRLKGRPPGTKKSTDPDKKKRKRVARERDLCDVKVKITEYFDGAELTEQTGQQPPLDDHPLTPAASAHDSGNHFFGQDSVPAQSQVAPWGLQNVGGLAMHGAPEPPPKKFYTVQRVNGNGGNGKGDGVAGPHKHTLEESDRVKKNSVLRWLAKNEKDKKKGQAGDSSKKTYHKKATGNALTTVKNHSNEDELKLYGSCFCPFVQRVWISLEHKQIPYQYIEVDPYKKPQSLLDVNPRGLVPAIRHGPTWSTHESTVIMEYFEDLNAGPSLLPPDPQSRATCRLWSDHVNRSIIPSFYRLLQAQDPNDQITHATELRTEIGKLVDVADRTGPFFLGSSLGFVDVQIAPWVVRLARVLGPYRGWPEPEEGSRWKKWVDAIENEKSVRSTTSDDGLYLDSYERYAENRPNTSQLANAVNSGRGLP